MFKRLRTSLSTWVPALAPPPQDGAADDENDPYRGLGNRSVGTWSGAAGLATVHRPRGKMLRTMGVSVASRISLFAEEALYLSERNALVLVRDIDDPRSALDTRTVYDVALERPDDDDEAAATEGHARCPLHCYWAYAHLKSLGFAVFRRRAQARPDGGDGEAPRVWDGGDGAVPVAFEAYEPDSRFSKRRLGTPKFLVFVALNGGWLPSVTQLAALVAAAAGVPVKAAVVAGDGTCLLFDITAGIPSLA